MQNKKECNKIQKPYISFSDVTVHFKDGHTEKCFARPMTEKVFEFYVSTGLFVCIDGIFRKYHLERVKPILYVDGKVDYEEDECWILDDTIEYVEMTELEEEEV